MTVRWVGVSGRVSDRDVALPDAKLVVADVSLRLRAAAAGVCR